jgi:glycosyltransferase involved in cell wall biosynthesis
MKILMLVPDCQMIDRRVLQQARSLTLAGHTITLISGFECAKAEEYDWEGVHIVRCQYDWDDQRLKRIRAKLPDNDKLKKWVNLAWMRGISKFLHLKPFDTYVIAQAERFPADVVHVHDLPVLKHGVYLAKRWGVPLVFDAHEIYYEQDVLPPRIQRRQRCEERRYVPKLSLFITVNDAIADHYKEMYGVRPLVLMNCADRPEAGFDATSRADLRKAAGLPADAVVVLYQGWISPERNIMTLVQATEHLMPEAFVAIIGYGEYEKQLRAELEGKPWKDRVRFLGRVEPDRILAMTAGADVGVIPYLPIDLNHKYCSPNKFFEYVQTGVPVIAHDLVFFRNMGEKYGVVRVGDLSTPTGMAKAVNAVLQDRASLAKMRQSCGIAAETLNWETESRKLLAAYERIAPQVRQKPMGASTTMMPQHSESR